MRSLPDNPNLRHLRQQAKDLLRGLREIRPEASLADAQASLAEQYGFRRWTDLKAEVDRGRGGADRADPDLARAIAERFGLGRVAGPMVSLARSDELGRPWGLTTDRGRWLVRATGAWIPIVDVEAEIALQEAAAAAGVRLPAPVRSRSGAIVEPVAGEEWRVNELLPSGPPLAAPVSSAITRTIGGVLATVHTLNHPVDRVSPWHAARLSRRPWSDLAASAAATGAGWADRFAAVVPVLEELDAIGRAAPAAAPVLCHNALGPAAVRVGAGDRVIVSGWEHAGGQPPAWELADALWHWTAGSDGEINLAGARAMVEGYHAVAGTVPALDMTAFSGAASSLGNYLSGEVHRALEATDPVDRRHAERSVRHVLAHLPSRSGFQRLLDVAVAGAAAR